MSLSFFMALSTCIQFYKFSRQLSAFSLCFSCLVSGLLVHSTIYLFMKISLSPDMILCGWLGLKRQLNNYLYHCFRKTTRQRTLFTLCWLSTKACMYAGSDWLSSSVSHRVAIERSVDKPITQKRNRDSSLGSRRERTWSKGCEFEYRQERRENFLPQT